MAAYTVTLFEAAADGIQPAALLSFGDKGPQVLSSLASLFKVLTLGRSERQARKVLMYKVQCHWPKQLVCCAVPLQCTGRLLQACSGAQAAPQCPAAGGLRPQAPGASKARC